MSWLGNTAWGTTGLRAGIGTEGECGATQPYEVRRVGDGGFGVMGMKEVRRAWTDPRLPGRWRHLCGVDTRPSADRS